MKPTKYFILVAIAILVLCNNCGGNRGTITIVNTTLKSINVTLDKKDIVLQSEQHYTQKGMKPGIYFVKFGDTPPIKVETKKKKTTVVDVTSDNCFVVADYSSQYDEKSDGLVKVVEKFVNQKTFTPSEKLISQLGEQLPEKVNHDKKITRLHRVDCSWIDNDQAIVDAIANLP